MGVFRWYNPKGKGLGKVKKITCPSELRTKEELQNWKNFSILLPSCFTMLENFY